MRKEISLSVHLKKGQTKIRLNLETWRHTMLQREVGIYNDENYHTIQSNDELLKEFGFSDDEIEKLHMLKLNGTINKDSIRVNQNEYEIEEYFDQLRKYICNPNNNKDSRILNEISEKLKYLNKADLNLDEYNNLPEHIQKLYNSYYPIQRDEDRINDENFILSLLSKYQNYISYISLNIKLTSKIDGKTNLLQLTTSADDMNHIKMSVTEELDDVADSRKCNIIPINELSTEFENMFKEFDSSKLINIQIPKIEVIEHIKQNYTKIIYAQELKPEIRKRQIELLKTTVKNENDLKSIDDIKTKLTKEDIEILSLKDGIPSDTQIIPNYNCVRKFFSIDDDVQEYLLQNKDAKLTILELIQLLGIIINKVKE